MKDTNRLSPLLSVSSSLPSVDSHRLSTVDYKKKTTFARSRTGEKDPRQRQSLTFKSKIVNDVLCRGTCLLSEFELTLKRQVEGVTASSWRNKISDHGRWESFLHRGGCNTFPTQALRTTGHESIQKEIEIRAWCPMPGCPTSRALRSRLEEEEREETSREEGDSGFMNEGH